VSFLIFTVVERASLTKFALTGSLPVFAGFGLVVGVHSSEGGLAKVLGERIVALSQFSWAMSKLAVLGERTVTGLEEVLAHLSLVLLLERVELALVAVEIVVVALLCEVAHDLARWVVEVFLGLAIGS